MSSASKANQWRSSWGKCREACQPLAYARGSVAGLGSTFMSRTWLESTAPQKPALANGCILMERV